jgi:hypothetical protein
MENGERALQKQAPREMRCTSIGGTSKLVESIIIKHVLCKNQGVTGLPTSAKPTVSTSGKPVPVSDQDPRRNKIWRERYSERYVFHHFREYF